MQNNKTNKQEITKILDRISRVEGQIKGIKKMVEGGKECVDIITQINAIRQAVAMLGVELLKNDFVCKQKNKEKISEEYLKTIFKIK